ncbi:hypothetical protein SGGMMB4_00628 [Sodalis glossinidius str. 'morsitans']|uniref:Uncharacterized protein n=1 Tax=Sodalis glossinidius (strain morsitans) TaxID=343509 RepID=A0A193QFG6_SODGM|nr:hypothetical protein SGGMMB4_00628 [Sodalis glossinidius str. 'morsitans']
MVITGGSRIIDAGLFFRVVYALASMLTPQSVLVFTFIALTAYYMFPSALKTLLKVMRRNITSRWSFLVISMTALTGATVPERKKFTGWQWGIDDGTI